MDTLLFWSVVRAHQSDIGGATHGAYNAGATEIWQEGLRVPPIRLTEGGVVRADLVDLLALNVRHPREFRGDLAAMIGAARLGERRLGRSLAEFGAATVRAAIEEYSTARSGRRAPWSRNGPMARTKARRCWTTTATAPRTSPSAPRVTGRGSDVTVDLTGSDPQVRGFVNSSHANMRSAVAMAFAYLLDPECPRNEGAFRPLRVIARPGTVVWARGGRAGDAVHQPLLQRNRRGDHRGAGRRLPGTRDGRVGAAVPHGAGGPRSRAPGGASSGTCSRRARAAAPRAAGDGWPAAGEWHSVGGIKFGSVEVAEARFPLFFEHHEFRAGSGGDGQHRGGDGGELVLRLETDEPARANTAGDGVRHGARGILGGADGAPHRYTLRAAGGAPRALRTKEVGIVDAAGQPAARARRRRWRLGHDRRGIEIMLPIGIDVGGTFTDVVAVDEAGRDHSPRPRTTPADQSEGVLEGLRTLAATAPDRAAGAAGDDRAHRPRHHRRDQRAARGQNGARSAC